MINYSMKNLYTTSIDIEYKTLRMHYNPTLFNADIPIKIPMFNYNINFGGWTFHEEFG